MNTGIILWSTDTPGPGEANLDILARGTLLHSLPLLLAPTIMEQFNPSLRNFIAMGKNYEKALAAHGEKGLKPTIGPSVHQESYSSWVLTLAEVSTCDLTCKGRAEAATISVSVTFAAKGYFDALVKMGELASESQGSKELEHALVPETTCSRCNGQNNMPVSSAVCCHHHGNTAIDFLLVTPLAAFHSGLSIGDVLFQMAEVHRQIQNQLEEMLKSFHNELLTQLEQKVELDSRYLSAALKKYQTEQRSKGDALDKCQAELKKLRKKSQGSKNPQKYSDKELQITGLFCWGD
ncbi:hypothetical protein A6R68_23002 [Neotoma lepida]|uniref:IMD domain-containing protein n=1 Tax=Neotoma lepida TaxID=56216 RepID=A0A1A6HXP5_NEOLE|nr:hypothetical protein A6R68_23002 [Neotoma lepida]